MGQILLSKMTVGNGEKYKLFSEFLKYRLGTYGLFIIPVYVNGSLA
jgi:hypothetical protein